VTNCNTFNIFQPNRETTKTRNRTNWGFKYPS